MTTVIYVHDEKESIAVQEKLKSVGIVWEDASPRNGYIMHTDFNFLYIGDGVIESADNNFAYAARNVQQVLNGETVILSPMLVEGAKKQINSNDIFMMGMLKSVEKLRDDIATEIKKMGIVL